MPTHQLKKRSIRKVQDPQTVADYIRALGNGAEFQAKKLEGLVAKAPRNRPAMRQLTQALLQEVVAGAIEWKGHKDNLRDWIEHGNRTLCRALPGLCEASASFQHAHLRALRVQVRGVLGESFARWKKSGARLSQHN